MNPEEVVIDGKNMKTTLVRRIYGKQEQALAEWEN